MHIYIQVYFSLWIQNLVKVTIGYGISYKNMKYMQNQCNTKILLGFHISHLSLDLVLEGLLIISFYSYVCFPYNWPCTFIMGPLPLAPKSAVTPCYL